MTIKQKKEWYMDCAAMHTNELSKHLAETGATEVEKAQELNRLLSHHKQFFDLFIAKGDFEKEMAKRFFR